MIIGFLLILATSLQTSLQEYSLTIEGLSCFAYSYSEMNDEKPLLVLVHGSPGDYKGWSKYMEDEELSSKYRILALDRPGFGKSVKANVLAYPNLEFQAKVVRAFVKKYAHRQKVTLVGHSVGAPIVSFVAAKYPDEIANLVLLAPAISAKNEQPRFYNRLAQKKWINKKIPPDMRTSQIEMMNISAQLDSLRTLLPNIRCKTWLFHGKMDMIAPYRNALYVKENFKNAPLVFKNYRFQNHFLPWTKFEDIKKLLVILP